MSRLIDADALHKDLREFYCKDCVNSSLSWVCYQCNVPELLHMVKTYPSAEETELKQKLSEAINKLKSNKKL